MNYSQSKAQEAINWHLVVERALTGDLTDDEQIAYTSYAANWVTCAVGNQCQIIPRTTGAWPEDDRLYYLGTGFSNAFRDGEYGYAKRILGVIEWRSSQLIGRIIREGEKHELLSV